VSKVNNPPKLKGDGQRRALEQAEKKAAEQQPGSFKEQATGEKVVEIGPDITAEPIKGIDSPEPTGSNR
jgi:hypothetical protein